MTGSSSGSDYCSHGSKAGCSKGNDCQSRRTSGWRSWSHKRADNCSHTGRGHNHHAVSGSHTSSNGHWRQNWTDVWHWTSVSDGSVGWTCDGGSVSTSRRERTSSTTSSGLGAASATLWSTIGRWSGSVRRSCSKGSFCKRRSSGSTCSWSCGYEVSRNSSSGRRSASRYSGSFVSSDVGSSNEDARRGGSRC